MLCGPGLLLLCLAGLQAQFLSEEADPRFGQIFESVSSDMDGDYYDNNLPFVEYDDQLPSASALTDRQIKIRDFYRRRRPLNKLKSTNGTVNKIMEKIAESKKKTKIEEEETKKKTLQRNPSGLAVTVVKPPPDFQPSSYPGLGPNNLISEATTAVPRRRVGTRLKDWSTSQKQRAAAATSLIGSRLKDLKEKRKSLKNTDLVREQSAEQDQARFDQEDVDLESMVKVKEKLRSHLMKVHIEEKSTETQNQIPIKIQRFKPQLKPTTASPKLSIKVSSDLPVKKKTKPTKPIKKIFKTAGEHVNQKKILVNSKAESASLEVPDEIIGLLQYLIFFLIVKRAVTSMYISSLFNAKKNAKNSSILEQNL